MVEPMALPQNAIVPSSQENKNDDFSQRFALTSYTKMGTTLSGPVTTHDVVSSFQLAQDAPFFIPRPNIATVISESIPLTSYV